MYWNTTAATSSWCSARRRQLVLIPASGKKRTKSLLGEIDMNLEELEPSCSVTRSSRNAVRPALVLEQREDGALAFVPDHVGEERSGLGGVERSLVREGESELEGSVVLDRLDEDRGLRAKSE